MLRFGQRFQAVPSSLEPDCRQAVSGRSRVSGGVQRGGGNGKQASGRRPGPCDSEGMESFCGKPLGLI